MAESRKWPARERLRVFVCLSGPEGGMQRRSDGGERGREKERKKKRQEGTNRRSWGGKERSRKGIERTNERKKLEGKEGR